MHNFPLLKNIDVEVEFDRFVPTFNNGCKIQNLLGDHSSLNLNADYFFPEDNFIVELKCMENDIIDNKDLRDRVIRCYLHYGYSEYDAEGYLYRNDIMPTKVKERFFSTAIKSMICQVKKANQQIAKTKQTLKLPNAHGMLLYANNKNYSLVPEAALVIIDKVLRDLRPRHIDCYVYFTPNISHNNSSGFRVKYWIPTYAPDKKYLGDFVDRLGKKWIEYYIKNQQIIFDTLIVEKNTPEVLRSKPIKNK